jgi:hypothetical protein
LNRSRVATLVGNILFVFYCTAVGVYLVLRPWSAGSPVGVLTSSGFFRGFVSGLGLIHLAVGFADLRVLSRILLGEEPAERRGA